MSEISPKLEEQLDRMVQLSKDLSTMTSELLTAVKKEFSPNELSKSYIENIYGGINDCADCGEFPSVTIGMVICKTKDCVFSHRSYMVHEWNSITKGSI